MTGNTLQASQGVQVPFRREGSLKGSTGDVAQYGTMADLPQTASRAVREDTRSGKSAERS